MAIWRVTFPAFRSNASGPPPLATQNVPCRSSSQNVISFPLILEGSFASCVNRIVFPLAGSSMKSPLKVANHKLPDRSSVMLMTGPSFSFVSFLPMRKCVNVSETGSYLSRYRSQPIQRVPEWSTKSSCPRRTAAAECIPWPSPSPPGSTPFSVHQATETP
jgi:hypothetical protein